MRVILILILSFCIKSFLFSQNEIPASIVPTSTISGFLNGKPLIINEYCESIDNKNCFMVDVQNEIFKGMSSIINGQEVKLYLYDNGQIMFLTQYENNKVNGPFIYFNKKGKVELILKYKDSKLEGVIYTINNKVLNKYFKKYGTDAPVSIKKETINY